MPIYVKNRLLQLRYKGIYTPPNPDFARCCATLTVSDVAHRPSRWLYTYWVFTYSFIKYRV